LGVIHATNCPSTLLLAQFSQKWEPVWREQHAIKQKLRAPDQVLSALKALSTPDGIINVLVRREYVEKAAQNAANSRKWMWPDQSKDQVPHPLKKININLNWSRRRHVCILKHDFVRKRPQYFAEHHTRI
jgi:hypothetical protein